MYSDFCLDALELFVAGAETKLGIHVFNQELEIDNYLDEFNVKLDMDRNVSAVTIRPPYEIYVEMYSTAVEKAKKSKQEAFEAFLEAKNIKSKYNLEESDTDIDIDDELEELSEIDKLWIIRDTIYNEVINRTF